MLIELKEKPTATAEIKGREGYEGIRGKMDIYDTYGGSILVAEVYGMPKNVEDGCGG